MRSSLSFNLALFSNPHGFEERCWKYVPTYVGWINAIIYTNTDLNPSDAMMITLGRDSTKVQTSIVTLGCQFPPQKKSKHDWVYAHRTIHDTAKSKCPLFPNAFAKGLYMIDSRWYERKKS